MRDEIEWYSAVCVHTLNITLTAIDVRSRLGHLPTIHTSYKMWYFFIVANVYGYRGCNAFFLPFW